MRKLALSTLLILLLACPLLVGGCKPASGRDSGRQVLEQLRGFDPNAIVLLAYLGNHQHGAMLQWPRVAFAIGDGTLLLTAAHCVDALCGSPGQAMSPDIVAISPYYGDAYSCEILAVDKNADVAILKASWPVHPALALAGEEELKAAKRIVIVSRPSKKAKKPPYRLGQQIRAEKLPVLALDEKRPYKAVVLKGTRSVVEGWSGSAMVLPGSGKVAGVLGRLQPVKLRLLNIPLRKDAAGCSVRSIWTLLRKHGLESAAQRQPAGLEPVKDAQPAFSLAMDYFEALLNEDTTKPVEIAREMVTLRPQSVHAQLFLAFGANLRAHARESKPDPFLALAESSYQEALRLEPNSAHAHAVYGNFLLNRGRNQEALAQTESALAADPNNSLAVVNRLVILGVTNPAQAEEFGSQLVEKDPNNARYWHYYGTALSKLDRYEQALAAAQKAVALDPKGLYEGGLADALATLDRLDEAEPLYKKMTKTCGCQRCWYRYALFLVNHRSGKLAESEKALKTAESKAHMLRVSQEDINSLRLQLFEKTSPEQAEGFARQLLEASPDNGLYWWHLAGILRTRQKHEHAAQAAQKAVDLRPDASYKPRLANTLAKAGRLEEAQKTYDAMLGDHPDRGRYWFWYAEFLLENFQDRVEEARQAMEKAQNASDRRWRVSDDDLRGLREEIGAKANARPEDRK
jgi:tetratricopeptide (TPR) repeat protein